MCLNAAILWNGSSSGKSKYVSFLNGLSLQAESSVRCVTHKRENGIQLVKLSDYGSAKDATSRCAHNTQITYILREVGSSWRSVGAGRRRKSGMTAAKLIRIRSFGDQNRFYPIHCNDKRI